MEIEEEKGQNKSKSEFLCKFLPPANQNDALMFSLVNNENMNRQKAKAALMAQQAGQQQPPVKQQDLMAMAPQPNQVPSVPTNMGAGVPLQGPGSPQQMGQNQLPEEQGIGALPANNLQRMAGGGITGQNYAEKGVVNSTDRMAPFADKHKLYVIFHNHGQPGDPNFSFDKSLAYGSRLMLNFDAGHYFGATGLNPCLLIERLHNRIVSIHIKDKTGPKAAEPNKNQQFGKGETPVNEMLQLVQKNKWPIECDIELEYNVPEGSDAVKEVVKCVAYCKAALVK